MGFDTTFEAHCTSWPLLKRLLNDSDLLKFDTDALIPFGSLEIPSYLTRSLSPSLGLHDAP